MNNLKAVLAAAVLSATMFAGGAIFTSSANAQTVALTNAQLMQRGEQGSARNLLRVKTRLEGLIDQLNNDRHDYDGHRVAAIADMQQARAQLEAAINWDATHHR